MSLPFRRFCRLRRPDRRPVGGLVPLLVCGILGGVVVSAAVLPVAMVAGVTAEATGRSFGQLPRELTQRSAPQVSRIFASDGKTQIAVMYDEFRSDVPLGQISANMQQAIITAEDRNFYRHNGVDLRGVARAFVNNNQGGDRQGASTLTMQYVRMSLAYAATNPQEVVDATRDTPKRKISEMRYALQVEKQLTKQQILERYLNIAPFGNQSYGIFAASDVYFGKSPKDLTVAEAALLAGMVKAPTAFDPTTAAGYPQARDRRNYIINGMLTLGYITPTQAAAAKKTPVPRTSRKVGNGCTAVAKNSWGFFCDYFYRWWLGQQAFGPTAYERERRLKGGGYRIITSLDVTVQNAARKRVSEQIKDTDRNALLIAGVEPGTGRIRALAANRKFKLDDPEHPQNRLSSNPAAAAKGLRGTYPNTTNPIITGGGDITGYQAGSVFKMFTMVAALEKGLPLGYAINAPERYISGYPIAPGPAACNGGFYCPSNAAPGEAGMYNMWTAFAASINTYFVPLQERVGAENVVDVARRFGIQFRAEQDARYAANTDLARQWGAFTLGVSASTPLDIANAYATLAGDGMYCRPTPVQAITTSDGQSMDIGTPACTRATTADVARAALDAARCPVGDDAQLGDCGSRRTAAAARRIVGHPIYGKTGTTDGDKTAALVIGSASLTLAGYLVNPDYANHSDRMSHAVVNPAVWNAMADALAGTSKKDFLKPADDKLISER